MYPNLFSAYSIFYANFRFSSHISWLETNRNEYIMRVLYEGEAARESSQHRIIAEAGVP